MNRQTLLPQSPSRYSTGNTKALHSRYFGDSLRETRKTQIAFANFKSPNYVRLQEGLLRSSVEDYKYKNKYNPKLLPFQNPSFTKFKVSYNVICAARYRKARDDYNAQFVREIQKLIDYSPTANDAASLVNCTSYTTFWPPYHNEAELNQTSRTFYKLSKKEQRRFDKIMNTNFIY